MFGLNQKSCTEVRCPYQQTIGLNLLKIALKPTLIIASFKLFLDFRDVFNHQVVPVSPANSQHVYLIETKLKGLIIQLDEDMQISLEYINRKHSLLYKNLDPVSHGGENIWFGPLKGLEPWQSL